MSAEIFDIVDPRILHLRLALMRMSRGWSWLGAAGVLREDVAYLMKRYENASEAATRALAWIEATFPADTFSGDRGEFASELADVREQLRFAIGPRND